MFPAGSKISSTTTYECEEAYVCDLRKAVEACCMMVLDEFARKTVTLIVHERRVSEQGHYVRYI